MKKLNMENTQIPAQRLAQAENSIIVGDAKSLERFLIEYKDNFKVKEWLDGVQSLEIDLNNCYKCACEIIAHAHWFDNWVDFEKFTKELIDEKSDVSQFEKAVDYIINGDLIQLRQLLNHNPDLTHARSVRKHQATLLIYTGANGVENFRQKTPANVVEIAETLLKAGAEIDAVGNMYRGTTTLGLVATSVHPEKAGVQEQLIDLLLKYGADYNLAVAPDYTNGNLILACLHNGRGKSAGYLASKGAPVDLEGAAGTGLLEKVKTYFNADGSLKEEASTEAKNLGFMWACAYGHLNVVKYMLRQGFDITHIVDGMTALHWASMGGHLDIIKVLIERGAPLEIRNAYGGTVLSQTLWVAYNDPKPQYSDIIDLLLVAGAKKEPEWDKYIDEIKEIQF